jgi:hypothetical protein
MMRASPGIVTDSVGELAAAETGASLSGGMITSHGLRQAEHNTSIRGEAADRVSSHGQYDAAFEPALWKLKPMDASITQLVWQDPMPADDKHSIINDGHHLIRIDAGQRHENQQFPVGLQDVDRRFPARPVNGRLEAEQPLMQPFGASKRFNRLRQHPVDRVLFWHLLFRQFSCGSKSTPKPMRLHYPGNREPIWRDHRELKTISLRADAGGRIF